LALPFRIQSYIYSYPNSPFSEEALFKCDFTNIICLKDMVNKSFSKF
jgi:hypothetical protein